MFVCLASLCRLAVDRVQPMYFEFAYCPNSGHGVARNRDSSFRGLNGLRQCSGPTYKRGRSGDLRCGVRRTDRAPFLSHVDILSGAQSERSLAKFAAIYSRRLTVFPIANTVKSYLSSGSGDIRIERRRLLYICNNSINPYFRNHYAEAAARLRATTAPLTLESVSFPGVV